MSPDWSTWIASSVVAFWPTPTRSPASTFSQIPTEIVSPGRMVSGERAPAFTKPEPKPSVSAEREAAAIGGVTSTTCMSRAGSLPPRLISPRVGPERGRAQPASAATRRSARAKLAVAIRGPCIDCLIALARRLLPRNLAIFAGRRPAERFGRGASCCRSAAIAASCRAARRGLGRGSEQGGSARCSPELSATSAPSSASRTGATCTPASAAAMRPQGIAIGASIACDGICLTVIDRGPGRRRRLVRRRPLGRDRRPHQRPAATAAPGPRGGGSTSSGRCGSGTSSAATSSRATSTGWPRSPALHPEGESVRFSFRAPEALARYLAPKGSVALNGTSLTVNEVEGASFGVNIIPHTLAVTTWGAAAAGRPREPRDRHAGALRRAADASTPRDDRPGIGHNRGPAMDDGRRLAAALLERRARRAPAAPAARGDPPEGAPGQGDRPRLPHLCAGARDLRARHHRLPLLLERARASSARATPCPRTAPSGCARSGTAPARCSPTAPLDAGAGSRRRSRPRPGIAFAGAAPAPRFAAPWAELRAGVLAALAGLPRRAASC